MNIVTKNVLVVVLCFPCCFTHKECDSNVDPTKFQANFLFGAATSAYQTEGGWDSDGKGPSTWDIGVHTHPEMVADQSNADITSDSYHLFDEDLKIIKELGLNHYRFSISWPRILPTGDLSSLNSAAVDYYNMIIDKLIANNIEPMVTMFHFDLPDELQKLGGVVNPLFEKYFKSYAGLLFELFGDRVKLWLTVNEPRLYCLASYGMGAFPPNINASGVGEYLCGDHILKGHAAAYHLYKEHYFEKFGGKIGIALDAFLHYAENRTVVNDRAMQYHVGWFAQPLLSEDGGYPDIMRKDIDRRSMEEGRAWSRLPKLSKEWKGIMRGACDFLGINYYTSRYSKPRTTRFNQNAPSFVDDSDIEEYTDSAWPVVNTSWLYSVPHGLRDLLRWIKGQYGDIEVIITENGSADSGQTDDVERMDYIIQHLRELLKAIHIDGCNVVGYTYWSLLDSYEWNSGFTTRFGLYSVNFSSPTRERSPKKSASLYRSIIATRQIH